MQKESKRGVRMAHQFLFSLEEKIRHLETRLLGLGPTLIAFSGGVDSSFLLAVAAKVQRGGTVALMTVSASTPPDDEQQANDLAKILDVQLIKIQHDELAIPQYAANPKNRCYFCKDSLYAICQREARRLNLPSIVDGVNVDDLSDYRPGLQAADEYGVTHPLVEAGFTKSDIRQGSKLFGLFTWDRPASPCLSSRIPYGTAITAAMLSQIAQGEAFLRSLGFKEVRLRHHGKVARVEITENELSFFVTSKLSSIIGKTLKDLGFPFAVLDVRGYKSGVFNDQVP
jgi:uncharacterized protein